jgi:Domain of unknown function (DUF4062)
MKVFVSSLISGLEAERAAVKRAIGVFRHEAIMAEDFGARASSPQVACLQGVRDADLVVLVLGHRYGARQASGLSATHEEFREAKGKKRILTFVQSGDAEPEQTAFIQEASGWERGLFRASFSNASELGDGVARAIHDHELAHAVAPLQPSELRDRALALLPDIRRDSSGAVFSFALAVGPTQSVLRPSEIEAPALTDALQQRALFGAPPLFDRSMGTKSGLDHGALVIHQERHHGKGALVALWESGDVLIQLPAFGTRSRGDISLPVVIEEDIAQALDACVAYAAWLLDHIDPTEKLTHVALAVRLAGGGYFGWRTRSEHAASPKSGSFSMFGREELRDAPVMLTPAHRARQALAMDTATLVEDLVVLLRRQWNQE